MGDEPNEPSAWLFERVGGEVGGEPVGAAPWPVTVRASEWTRGPWDHGVMHGGGICGLLGWAVERQMRGAVAAKRAAGTQGAEGSAGAESSDPLGGLVPSRMTVEILAGVPVAELVVAASTVKLGRQTAVVEAAFGLPPDSGVDAGRAADGDPGGSASALVNRPLARASVQFLAPVSGSQTDDYLPGAQVRTDVPPPEQFERADPGANPDLSYPRPGFNADAVELRFVEGTTETAGAGVVWARLDTPLMAGEPTSPFATLATLSDLGAAVGWDYSPAGGALINTDVTVQLLRQPQDEWLLFESATVWSGGGVACCRSTISDRRGLLGWVLQSQLEAPHNLGLPGGVAAAAARLAARR